MIDFIRTNHLFPQISQALNLETLVSISSYQLPMQYSRRLIREMKFEVYFLTYQRYLIWFVHNGLIFKLEQNGISGKLLRLMKRFLK